MKIYHVFNEDLMYACVTRFNHFVRHRIFGPHQIADVTHMVKKEPLQLQVNSSFKTLTLLFLTESPKYYEVMYPSSQSNMKPYRTICYQRMVYTKSQLRILSILVITEPN
ncbi:hypothetical protein M758_5G158400 [Ceratodon purpureus]|nr:hypothetical protein M758_5G158400 [Ceratodon purpureus]